MVQVFDPYVYIGNANFTAALNKTYAMRCDSARTITLPAAATLGAGSFSVIWAYGSGSLTFTGAAIYTTGNPFGNSSNVASVTFDSKFDGHRFDVTSDGGSWLISVGAIDAWLPLAGGTLTGTENIDMLNGVGLSLRNTNNNNGQYAPVVQYGSTSQWWGQLRSYKQGQNGPAEAYLELYTSNGGWSAQAAFRTTIASPVGIYINGDSSAVSHTNRSDERLKDTFEALPEGIERALFDLPITTYWMGDPDLEACERIGEDGEPYQQEARKNTARRRHIGFTAQNLEALLPIPEAVMVEHGADLRGIDTIKGYDIGSLLSLAIFTIQRLHKRIEALEQKVNQ